MKLISLENMGVGGIVRDKPDHTLAPEYWSEGKNVRFINGKAVKFLGEQETYPTWVVTSLITSGTLTATTSSGILTDSSTDFIAAGVGVGDEIRNITQSTSGFFQTVTTTQLTTVPALASNIGDTYEIWTYPVVPSQAYFTSVGSANVAAHLFADTAGTGVNFDSLRVFPGDLLQDNGTGIQYTITGVPSPNLLSYSGAFSSSNASYSLVRSATPKTSAYPPLWLQPWRDASATGFWLAATKKSILRFTAGSATDITRASSAYVGDEDTIWSGGVLGGIPIFNNDAGDKPQSYDVSSGLFVDLPNWLPGDRANIVRLFKQFVIAYDITRAGNRLPHTVKWSSPAQPGAVPDFWDNANSNDSNESTLSEGGGFIVDSEPLGDVNIIYKEEKCYGMQHIGGEFVFRFYELPFKAGMLAPRCAKTILGKAFIVTKEDVILHNGNEAVSVIDGFNRNYLFDTMAQAKTRKTFVVPNHAFNEVWICFVSNSIDGTYADEALVWNYKDNTWGHKQLFAVPHIAYGLLDQSSKSTIIDDQEQFIDDNTSLIDGNAFNSGRFRLLGSQINTPNSKLLEFDTGTDNANGVMTSFVERTGIAFVGKDRQGRPKTDVTSTKFVQRIYPKIDSTDTVDIYVGVQTRLGQSVSYNGPYSFDPVNATFFDVRLQGKVVAIKIQSTSSTQWEATGVSFELEVLGGSNR